MLITILAFLSFVAAPATDALDRGYDALYNLDFNAAHKEFAEWEREQPNDPLGPVSDAAAYLFSEFDRLKILRSEFLTNDSSFVGQRKLNADPAVKAAFESALEKGRQLTQAMTKNGQQPERALFADTIATGMHADYMALVEKNNWQALKEVKLARSKAEALLAKYPDYKDAYLPIGVENYVLSQKIAPLRFLLHVTGSQTDKETGLQKLRIVADGGHYLKPYAKILLAIAAARDHDKNRAASLLQGLLAQFPHNELFKEEIQKMTCRSGC